MILMDNQILCHSTIFGLTITQCTVCIRSNVRVCLGRSTVKREADHRSGEHHGNVVVGSIVAYHGKFHLAGVGGQGDDLVRLWIYRIVVEWEVKCGNWRNSTLNSNLFGLLLLLFEFLNNSLLDELFLALLPLLALRILR